MFHKLHIADLNNLCGFRKGKLQTSLSSNDHFSTLDVATCSYSKCSHIGLALDWTGPLSQGALASGRGVKVSSCIWQRSRFSAKEAHNILATFKVIQCSSSNEDDVFSWFCIFCIMSIDSFCLGAPEVCSVVQEWFRAFWNYCLCLVLPLSVYCSSKWHTSRNRQVFAIPLKYISLTRHHHFSQVLDLLPDSLVHFSRQSLLPKTYSAFSSSSMYIVQCGSVDNVILQSFKKTPCTILVNT